MSNVARNLLLLLSAILLLFLAFIAGAFFGDSFLVEASEDRAVSGGNLDDFALLDEAWGWIERSYLGEVPPVTQITYGAIRGALGELGDPYTTFVEPPDRSDERERLSGNFGGIGAYLNRNSDNELVLEPIPGNPAEAAGIVSGDVLLAVDGVEITEDLPVGDVADLIKGEKGTSVTLTVRHAEEETPVDIAVVRDDILVPSVSYRILDEVAGDVAGDVASIGYIQLTRFSGESGGEIEAAIVDLKSQGAEKLILDLRHNPGGLLTASVDVADHFLSDVPVLYQQSQGQDEEVYTASEGAAADGMALVVLIDGGTASSAEILAGALHDHGRATLIGMPSFGKGSVQLVYDLSDGSSVHVTSSRWFTPDRNQIDQEGLQPDIVVETTQEAIDEGRDDFILRAIEYLLSENG